MVRTSRPWKENTTSSISLAPSVRRFSERKIVTMNMRTRFIAIIIIQGSSRNDAMDVIQQS